MTSPNSTTPSDNTSEEQAKRLTHFDQKGQAHMVDIGDKTPTKRSALATGSIYMSEQAFSQLQNTTANKGDVLAIARIAAIGASKQTSNLIPLCHPLPLTKVSVEFELHQQEQRADIFVTAETLGRTGVEMEALTATSIGLLTIYDMLKAVDKGMRIEGITLLRKEGGKSGLFVNPNQ